MFAVPSLLWYPLSVSSDVSAVVRGIEMGFAHAPLYQVYVQSGLAIDFFTVGICSCFPINFVDFIMGNDIAGGKDNPVPEVVSVPIYDSDQDGLTTTHPHVLLLSCLRKKCPVVVILRVTL